MEKRLLEINARKQEIRGLLSNPECDLNALETEVAALEKEEQELRKKAEIIKNINAGTLGNNLPKPQEPEDRAATDIKDTLEYRNAFKAYVTKGTPIPQEMRADETSTTVDIGALIPNTILNRVVEKLESVGQILSLVTKTAIKGGVTVPVSSVKPVATWVAEGSGSDKQKKTVGKISFAYHKLRCAVAVTLETDTMALSAFETTIVNNITDAMVMAIEQAIINGSGIGQPKGILQETPNSGQSVSSATFGYADMVKAEAALPLEYEPTSVWVMAKKTFMSLVGELDTVGQPVARVNYGLNAKTERTLLGRPVVLCNYMDSYSESLAVGKVFAAIFNFSDYILNTNFNMGLKKYEDNETDDLVTKAVMLVDGKAVDTNSLVIVKKATA